MTMYLGDIPLGSVIPIPFTTYAGSTGASVTTSGLAVTDIEVYKGTSMTQRASDAGFTLLDTDGIDLDGVTGIQGFSIDTGDNTDAGFFVAGSFYWVVVASITVDSQTVNFIPAMWRMVAAESTAGTPKADVSMFGGTAGTFSGGRPEVNTSHAAGTAWGSGAITAGAIAADAITAAKVAADVTTELQSGLATSAALATVDGVADAILALLGTPAGASVSADIAAAKAAIDVIDDFVDSIPADVWAYTVEGSFTAVQYLRIITAALAAKLSGAATTTVSIRDTGDTKNRVVATVTADGDRTAVTLDGT